MAALRDLVPHVALVAPALAEPLIVELLRQSVDELARRTRCWLVEPDEVDVEEGEPRYAIPVAGGLVPVRIEELRLFGAGGTGGTLLEPCNVPDWFRDPDSWAEVAGIPARYAQVTPEQVVLDAVPAMGDSAWTLRFKLSVRCGPTTSDIPTSLMRDQWQTIVAGAKAAAMMMPGPHLNPDLSAIERAKFEAEVTRETWRVAKGFVSSGPATRAAFF
jgi:hypothetical protein